MFHHSTTTLQLPCTELRVLGIYLDADISMRTHISRTVDGCFAALRKLRTFRRSVPIILAVYQTLIVALVLSRLDYGNATLSGIPANCRHLQSVHNAAARSVAGLRRWDRALASFHWLCAPEHIQFKLATLT